MGNSVHFGPLILILQVYEVYELLDKTNEILLSTSFVLTFATYECLLGKTGRLSHKLQRISRVECKCAFYMCI